MSGSTQGIVYIVVALLGSGGISAYLASRPAKSTREGALIDQYQERYAEQESRLDKQEERVERQDKAIAMLGDRLDAMRRREIVYRNYIYELIHHIDEKVGPPPPPMPAELSRNAS